MSIELALSISGAAREAGAGIMDIYETGDFGVEIKSDKSPLTRADLLSHDLITEFLRRTTPDIPVISEEGEEAAFALRSSWNTFYLVDPLDGTRSFINKGGEFTVNVALVVDGRPELGVIYAPASDTLYYASRDEGAFSQKGAGGPERIHVSESRSLDGLVAVVSRSHSSNERDAFENTGIVSNYAPSGSSLKFCLVADGSAHLYPRFGPIYEWDTAAGHAILLEAGGRVVDLMEFNEIQYNKSEMLHHGFLALPGWMLDGIIPYMKGIR